MLVGVHSRLVVQRSQSIFRLFSVFSDQFDVTLNREHWPKPLRTHSCNALSLLNEKESVLISGWVDSVRMMKDAVFIVIRDGHGKTQTIFDCDKDVEDVLKYISLESSICVDGTVRKRPNEAINSEMSTGSIEVKGSRLYLLNPAVDLPFPYHGKLPKDEVLSKYRHLALRHKKQLDEVVFRSSFLESLRTSISSQSFVEVQTPLLTRSSPEGAHEFYVPSALLPRGGFALSQSPQQYKQVLMSSGIDRYYQIARCFRNEYGRKDRQLEFTQLDLEMAYITDIQQVMEVVEQCIEDTLTKLSFSNSISFSTMLYHDALTKYGSDKPDLRIPCTLQHLPSTVQQASNINQVISLHLPGLSKVMSASRLKQLLKELEASSIGSYRILKCDVSKEAHLHSSSSCSALLQMKHVENEIKSSSELHEGDLVLLGVDVTNSTQKVNQYELEILLGKMRVIIWEMGQQANLVKSYDKIQSSSTPLQFLWVKHFPLFEYDKSGHIKSAHHPFTSPIDYHSVDSIQTVDIMKLLSSSCDLVLNGNEIGGGSLRIHDYQLQCYLMNQVLGIQNLDVFNHLLNALKHGCPPHGGFAIGVDRLLTILRDKTSIREVITFPKSITGADLLTSAPTLITDEQWKEVGMS